jgi:transposase
MDHIGIDVHKRESQIPIFAEGGALYEQRIRTEPGRFAALLGARPRARVLIEASTDSEWVARCLGAPCHEVIVADPNFAPIYATRSRESKADRTSRDRPHCHWPAVNDTNLQIGEHGPHHELTRAAAS